jgi:hypothetical protein
MKWHWTIALLTLAAAPAQAAGGFLEGGVGALYGDLSAVRYDDPVGSFFTANPRDGSRIRPQHLRRTPWASAASLSVGYRLDAPFFLRATYRYFGEDEATADGIFFRNPIDPRQLSGPFPQRLTTTAHGIFLGAGVEWEPGPRCFVDAEFEVGASLVRAAGVRDVNTVIEEPFPAASRINPAYGAGLTIGRRLSGDLALELMVNWDHLGAADTGRAPDIGGGPRFVSPAVRPNASLTSTLTAVAVNLGLRYAF